jgi:Fe-S cluster assembly iron-binding protein IscA
MLQITEAAETALKQIRQENDFPDSAALRIAAVRTPEGGTGIGFAFTDGPEEGDATISEKADFRVYLSPDLMDGFDGAALDATASEEGIELELRSQSGMHDHETAEQHDGHKHFGHKHD